MGFKKIKSLRINGLLLFQIKLLKHINMPAHRITVILYQIQAQKPSLRLVLEANCTKNLSLEQHTMGRDTQIP